MPTTMPIAVVSSRGRDAMNSEVRMPYTSRMKMSRPRRLEAEPVLAGDAAEVAQRHAVAGDLVLELLVRADAVQQLDQRRGQPEPR